MDEKAITDSIVAGVAFCSFLWGLWIYWLQKKRDHELAVAKDRLSRFDKFQDFEKRYREEDALIKVRYWIYRGQHSSGGTPVPSIPVPDDYEMQQFMGFFEEIAIMINFWAHERRSGCLHSWHRCGQILCYGDHLSQ